MLRVCELVLLAGVWDVAQSLGLTWTVCKLQLPTELHTSFSVLSEGSLGQNPTEQELQDWIGGDGEHEPLGLPMIHIHIHIYIYTHIYFAYIFMCVYNKQ